MIADSTGGMQQALQKFDDMPMKTPTLPNTTNHQNPVIAHAARYLVSKYGSFEQIPSDNAISTQVFLISFLSFLLPALPTRKR